jgi:hypothetical protein
MIMSHARRFPRPLVSLCLSLAMLTLSAPRASAWGGAGHRIVAEIAMWRLAKLRDAGDARAARALQRVARILASQPETPLKFKPGTIEAAAVWPDQVRRKVPEFNFANNLHFDSIPVDAGVDHDSFDRATECKPIPQVAEGECAVGAVEHFGGVLASPAAGRRALLVALSFVVHFVGDLHQPLHNAENPLPGGTPDRGGNLRLVFYLDRALFLDPRPRSCFDDPGVCIDIFDTGKASKNLHSAWDKYMIETEMAANANRKTEPEYAAALEGTLPADPHAARFTEIESGTLVEWAEAAHDLAEKHAYAVTAPRRKVSPADDEEHDFSLVSNTYRAANIRIVDRQLLAAGIRLASILRQNLGGS